MAIRKVIDLAADLAYNLAKRGQTVVTSTDSNGNPTMTFGTATATNNGGSIRLKDFTVIGVDSLGNTMPDFANSVVQVVLEGSADPAISTSIADHVQAATAMTVLGCAVQLGARVELYLVNAGDNPTIAQLDIDGVLVSTFDPSLVGRIMGQQ